MAKSKTDSVQSLLDGWVENQQKLWDGWMQTVQQIGGAAPVAKTWQQGLGHWRDAVEQTLETQKQATRAWAQQVSQLEHASDDVNRWAEQGVALVERWSDTQQTLWRQWFDLMSAATPAASGPPKDERMRQLMDGWEQATEHMQQLQRKWAESFGLVSGAGKR